MASGIGTQRPSEFSIDENVGLKKPPTARKPRHLFTADALIEIDSKIEIVTDELRMVSKRSSSSRSSRTIGGDRSV